MMLLLFTLIVTNVYVFFLLKKYRFKLQTAQNETGKWKKHYCEKDSQCIILDEELKKSQLLARLVEQSPNAIMVMNSDGDIRLINEGFSRMYGYTFNEFITELGSNYRQTSFSPDVQARLDSVFEACKPYRYEAPNVTKDGRRIWTQTALMPILDDDGMITHLATIDTDIEQRVEMSDKLVEEVERLNEKIDLIAGEFKNFSDEFNRVFFTIGELYAAIAKTDGILRFIKDISAQTRLIGFNASIEAGRAGEYGHSFRVITNEIVDIAQRTGLRVQQINDVFDSIKLEQGVLDDEKQKAGENMKILGEKLNVLKRELYSIEEAITGFKSLS
ncbi:MAG: methyl-accepting chemotaxis protein [Prolixibacteraceae bacterium]|jgi:PAS domain S-box-containing protein|nr:methyl-accepting chemotaxis protein [Prolixibacteraceae bacterium]